MTRNPAPVVQRDDDFMPQQLLVDVGEAPLQISGQLEFDPHREEDGGDVQHQPADSQAEEREACEAGEEETQEDNEGDRDPHD